MRTFLTLLIVLTLFSCKDVASEQTATEDWGFPYFEKVDSLNPILKPTAELTFKDPITDTLVNWEERNVLNPTAVVRNDTVFLLYRAQDLQGTSRIGMAWSTDGLNFTKFNERYEFWCGECGQIDFMW